MSKDFSGIIPPLITSFNKKGKFDPRAQREVVRFLLPNVNGFYPVGTYGSGPLMALSERKAVAEVVVEEVNGRVPVIVHIGAVSTEQAVELAKHAQTIGADAIGAIPPYYYHYNQAHLLEYFRAILHATDLPFFAYNNPGLSNNPLTPALIDQLAEEGLFGLKDSSFDLVVFSEFLNTIKKPGFCFIVGTEAIAAAALSAGAKGVISGLANVWPELMQELWRAFQANDAKLAGQLQLKILQARAVLKMAPTLVVCYEVLRMRGVNAGYPKPPYLPLVGALCEKIKSAFSDLGLLF